MCLIVFANNYHPDYKLILAANRDEFYKRPALPAKFWDDHPELLAGKDLEAGGTWLGISKNGRFSAITNFRDPESLKKTKTSRGQLTTDFLLSSTSPEDYIKSLINAAGNYNGFNLLVGTLSDLYFFSNRLEKPQKLKPGVYGLSNHLLDTPWTKVVKSKNALKEIIKDDKLSVDKLFELLSDTTVPPDNELPDTGVGIEIERIAAPVFIKNEFYGTRSSTVILIDKNDNVLFVEKSLDTETDKWIESRFEFKINE